MKTKSSFFVALCLCSLMTFEAKAQKPQIAAYKYFAVGDGVNKPGVYSLPHGAEITIMEALKMAGGAWDGDSLNTPLANLRNIRVMRLIDGEQRDIKIDVSKKGHDQKFMVRAGDIIVVPYFM